MADKIVKTEFTGGMRFKSNFDDGHHIIIDTAENDGGSNSGPRPKQLMLSALAGCTGIDIISLLNKMRVEFSNFSIDTEANLSADHPRIYTEVKVIYRISVKPADREKVEKAVNLSKEKYCGVSAMFDKFANMSFEIIYS
ncbi:OsmC family peroxiredoxin [Lacibacter luteus]|uniref:OsmC family peroxiredoxin n=1 Tax=Lacibacter luteus TaxID=2508719 RepID=A0A4Q1CE66_9BACT|nr:OsmC family protein [Lacibacter luteus]RXK57721.1 OsmC family peroxiredoxin [Lacibacter luteus]